MKEPGISIWKNKMWQVKALFQYEGGFMRTKPASSPPIRRSASTSASQRPKWTTGEQTKTFMCKLHHWAAETNSALNCRFEMRRSKKRDSSYCQFAVLQENKSVYKKRRWNLAFASAGSRGRCKRGAEMHPNDRWVFLRNKKVLAPAAETALKCPDSSARVNTETKTKNLKPECLSRVLWQLIQDLITADVSAGSRSTRVLKKNIEQANKYQYSGDQMENIRVWSCSVFMSTGFWTKPDQKPDHLTCRQKPISHQNSETNVCVDTLAHEENLWWSRMWLKGHWLMLHTEEDGENEPIWSFFNPTMKRAHGESDWSSACRSGSFYLFQ